MWEIRVSSGLALKSTPPMRLLLIPQRKKPAWQAQVSFFWLVLIYSFSLHKCAHVSNKPPPVPSVQATATVPRAFRWGNSLSLTRKQTRIAEVNDNYSKGHWSREVFKVKRNACAENNTNGLV